MTKNGSGKPKKEIARVEQGSRSSICVVSPLQPGCRIPRVVRLHIFTRLLKFGGAEATQGYNLLMTLARYPAPKLLSIFTTRTLGEQQLSMPSSARIREYGGRRPADVERNGRSQFLLSNQPHRLSDSYPLECGTDVQGKTT